MDFLIILLAHWLADYALPHAQRSENQRMKSLLLHVVLYGLVMTATGTLLYSWQVGLGYGVFNVVLHLLTDLITEKAMRASKGRPKTHFILHGFDQLVHTACLYWTFINADVLAL
ncbi:DUF3307 domain-containing protein [Flagellimonas sp. DF-77]|uniref:DUF3307 domain-containing protein n=1 Tax=Flagellimonas algarum TaxID=3230298 RepID=UPI003396EA86